MAPRVNHQLVREMAARMPRPSDDEIAAAAGCHPGYARLIYTGRVKLRGEGGSALSREEPKTLAGRPARGLLPFDHAALMGGHTLYPGTVIEAGSERVLKSGFNSAKIGARIMKGRWKGFPVFTLTLEERATCPTSCRHWRSCFGNNMQQARRFRHGAALESQIAAEVAALAAEHRLGFAIRLHVLGDFYSVGYVNLWRDLLAKHPQLHAFGFSARWDYARDPVAKALVELVEANWSRFAIRFSNAPIEAFATRSVEHPYQIEKDAVWCPQQAGKTQACSTCALCWQTTKNVAFVQH